MVVHNFDQAQALIDRLMESVGGSADAYESHTLEFLADKSSLADRKKDLVFQTLVTDLPTLDCLDGDAKDFTREELKGLWCSPPPITPEYQTHGVVEDAGELKLIFEGLEKSAKSEQSVTMNIDSGTHNTEAIFGGGWSVTDKVKDRLYILETGVCHYDVVNPEDTFIWVLQASDQDICLGYIHEGYVFMHS